MTPRARKVAGFALGFLPAFAVATWLYPAFLPAYQRLVFGAANAGLSRLSPLVEIRADVAERWEFVLHRGRATGVATYATDNRENVGALTFFHVVVLAALLVATPTGAVRRIGLTLAGTGLMLVAHVLCVAGCAYALAVIADPRTFLFQALPIALPPAATALAIAIWGTLTWRDWVGPGAVALD